MRIFINPGHDFLGVHDPGAMNPHTGERECDIAAECALHLEEALEKRGHKVQVFQLDNLETICRLANQWDTDVFISLHCNACESHKARGIETYFYSFFGNEIATAVQRNLCTTMGDSMPNRGIKPANFYVLTHTQAPAILVELGFIDNDEDLRIMKKELKNMAEGIASAFDVH